MSFPASAVAVQVPREGSAARQPTPPLQHAATNEKTKAHCAHHDWRPSRWRPPPPQDRTSCPFPWWAPHSTAPPGETDPGRSPHPSLCFNFRLLFFHVSWWRSKSVADRKRPAKTNVNNRSTKGVTEGLSSSKRSDEESGENMCASGTIEIRSTRSAHQQEEQSKESAGHVKVIDKKKGRERSGAGRTIERERWSPKSLRKDREK